MLFLLLVALVLGDSAQQHAPPRPCFWCPGCVPCPARPPVSSAGCGKPHGERWRPRWAMGDSIYMYCYTNENTTVGDRHPCPLGWMAGGGVKAGVFGGIVGFDHYYSKRGLAACCLQQHATSVPHSVHAFAYGLLRCFVCHCSEPGHAMRQIWRATGVRATG